MVSWFKGLQSIMAGKVGSSMTWWWAAAGSRGFWQQLAHISADQEDQTGSWRGYKYQGLIVAAYIVHIRKVLKPPSNRELLAGESVFKPMNLCGTFHI